MRPRSNNPLTNFLSFVSAETWRCMFGGGGGGVPSAPPPPAPPAPPAPAKATSSARSLLTQLMPKRTRASTVLTGGPAVSGASTRSLLGTPLT